MSGESLGIELQPRDWELLRGLFESRVMTLAHIAALYFDGKKPMATKRLQRLKAAGLLRERPKMLPTYPSILFLTKKAFRLLQDHGDFTAYPRISINDLDKRAQVSDRTIQHELQVMDIKAAFVKAVKQDAKYELMEFSTWPTLYQFDSFDRGGKRIRVQPDGFVRIREHEQDGGIQESAFFLEVDRSHEVREILANKAHCYMDYRRSGGYAVRNGNPNSHRQPWSPVQLPHNSIYHDALSTGRAEVMDLLCGWSCRNPRCLKSNLSSICELI
ncbi:MAG TPA: replication-relaxation family protein [Tepidisphaeraceae bacterium]|nr:replication-relaxation family protein [Tepidisphaeraceae bacterium]